MCIFVLIIGNDNVVQVIRKGIIELKLTSGKILKLFDVQHVPEIRRNLISGSLLVQLSYKIILESNKVIISRGNIFIRKEFDQDGMFKINVESLLLNEISSSSQAIIYNSKSCNVWHDKLGHVNL
jgi:hypothetical protein